MIIAALTVAMLLVIWFKTDAFVEYARLLGLSRWFSIKEFVAVKSDNPSLLYSEFLLEFKDNFFSRLFSCSICTSVWFGLIVSALFGILNMCLAVSFVALVAYELHDVWLQIQSFIKS